MAAAWAVATPARCTCLDGLLELEFVVTTILGTDNNIPAAHNNILEKVAKVGDKWSGSCARGLSDGSRCNHLMILVEKMSFEQGNHIHHG
jgi:hypothetical protein